MNQVQIDLAKSLLNINSKLESNFAKLFSLVQQPKTKCFYEGFLLSVTANGTSQGQDITVQDSTFKNSITTVDDIAVVASAYDVGDTFDVLYKGSKVAATIPWITSIALPFEPPLILEPGQAFRFVWNNTSTAKKVAIILKRGV